VNPEIPYMLQTGNLPKILDAIQKAGAPPTFNVEFLKDLGFTSSQDRPTPKILKYLGFLDGNNHPQATYRDFMDHNKSKKVLAARLRLAFDDLFMADKNAHLKTAEHLKGWFKTKTGAGDSVADKIARTFKVLATYADFNNVTADSDLEATAGEDNLKQINEQLNDTSGSAATSSQRSSPHTGAKSQFGLVYRFEIHLPDTQNVDTFRAIFRALREELM
jgi:hypothetical protein